MSISRDSPAYYVQILRLPGKMMRLPALFQQAGSLNETLFVHTNNWLGNAL